MAMLERACKMLADQFIGATVIDTDSQKFQGIENKPPRGSLVDHLGFYSLPPSTEVAGVNVPEEEIPPTLPPQRADCSTESCLTSHESSGGLALEGSPSAGKRRMLGMDSMTAPLIWSEANMKTQAINLGQGNHPLGITRYGGL
jgi:hypothetical protein